MVGLVTNVPLTPGITRRLLHHVDSDSQQVRAYVEGPYGISQDLTCYDTVLLISGECTPSALSSPPGGTGITYVLSYFLAVLAAAREGRAATRHIHLVWHVRHASHVSWVAPLLNEALSGVPLDMTVQVDVYLTKSSLGEDPSAEPMAEMKSNAESPAGTSHSSLETPSSLEDEKKEVREGHVGGEGLSHTASTYVRWRAGRADLAEIVQEDVGAARGTMNVSVCGPTQLTVDTRKAVSKVATPGKVFNGQQPIEFHSETFGW
jgi:ferric-chelate reductase